MTWIETLIYVLGGSGCIGGIYSIYTAKVQKRKIQVEVTQMLNDEWENLFDKLKKETNDRIGELENKIYKMELKDEIKNRAINKFIKCMYVQKGNSCPVATFMDETDDLLRSRLTPEQLAELNKNG